MTDSAGVTFVGKTATSNLGAHITNAGDINNDGLDDALITAPFEALGASYVVFGSDTLDSLTVDSLDGSNGFRIEPFLPPTNGGPFSFDFITIEPGGTALGDFNGDGIDDLAVATKTLQSDANGGAITAEAHVIFGSSLAFPATLNLGDLNGVNGVSIIGAEGEFTGLSAGDADGDGRDDLALSVSPIPQVAGEVIPGTIGSAGYVVFGPGSGTSSEIDIADLDGTNGFAVEAPVPTLALDDVTTGADDFARSSISFIGDVDDNGTDDLGIRTFDLDTTVDGELLGEDVTFTSRGFVLTGTIGTAFAAQIDLDTDATELNWPVINFTGPSFAEGSLPLAEQIDRDLTFIGIGDITGDDIADFAVVDDSSDEIHIFFGGGTVTAPDVTLSYTGAGSFDGGVAGLGDVNGDGVGDLGIGIGAYQTNAGLADVAFVMLGRDLATAPAFASLIDLNAVSPAVLGDFGYRIDSEFDGSAVAVAALGDLNGDGNQDFGIGLDRAVSAQPGLPADNAAGRVHAVFGGDFNLEALDQVDGINDNILNTVNLPFDPVLPIEPIFLRVINDGFISQSFEEGDQFSSVPYTFEIERSGNLDEPVSVQYQVAGAGSNPTNTSDFSLGATLSGEVFFGAGETTKSVTIDVEGDNRTEEDELFSFNISNPTTPNDVPVTITAPETFGEILNDDTTIDVRVRGVNAFEDFGTLQFIVERSGNIEDPFSLQYDLAGGPFAPADNQDAFLDSGFVSFASFQTTATVDVFLEADATVEPDETVQITLSEDIGATDNDINFIQSNATAFILNDDSPSFLLLSGPPVVVEGSFFPTEIEYTVFRFGGLNGDLTVDYQIRPETFGGFGDGIEANDIFNSITGTDSLFFSTGQSQATIRVTVNPDFQIEAAESLRVSLTDVQSGFGGASATILSGTAITTIFDDDIFAPPRPFGWGADIGGDPHVVTLDGLGYDFQAVGEYTLIKSELAGDANPFEVQVRFEPLPGSDLVSITTRMAVEVNGVQVEIDAVAEDPLFIGGAPASEEALALGAVDLDGDGTYDVFIDSEENSYTIVLNDLNEQLKVDVRDGWIDVSVFLSDDAAGGHAGAVAGLMGNANGDLTDEFALRDGTVLPQPVEFETLYGVYAESWAILDGTRQFTDTAPDFPDTFPVTKITLDDLPESLLDAAAAAVEAGGIDPDANPIVFEAAVLDFALTSKTDFIEGATDLAADPQAEAVPEDAPELELTVGVTASIPDVTEGDEGATDVTFTFYRLGPIDAPLDVTYAISGIDAEELGGAPLSGTASFSVGDDTVTLILPISGDLLVEGDETLQVEITGTSDPSAMIASASAQTIIVDDDFAPIAVDDILTGTDEAPISGNVFAPNPLGVDEDPDGDPLSISAVTIDGTEELLSSAPFTLLSGSTLAISSDGNFTYTADPGLAPGAEVMDSFSYTVTDGFGGFDTAEVMIGVMAIDNAPVLGDDGFVTVEETQIVGSVAGNDSDPEGATLIFAEGVGPTSGNLDFNADGTFTYDPAAGFFGEDSFTYTATDGSNTSTATVTISVADIDDPNVSIFANTSLNTKLSDHPTLEEALDVATAGQVVRVNAPDVIGGVGSVTIEIEDLAIIGDAPFAREFSLGAGISDFSIGGTTESDVTGNDANNVITGSFGNNTIDGGGGADKLLGSDGNDLLIGGSGKDTLEGGSGLNVLDGGLDDDIYVIRAATDIIVEAASAEGGRDVVEAKVDYTLLEGQKIEVMLARAGGQTGLMLEGNNFRNDIRGNAANDTLIGGGGNDVLRGKGGENVLEGGRGNDRLYANAGENTLIGGVGNDIYYWRDPDTTIVELDGEGRDTVLARIDYTAVAGLSIEDIGTNDDRGGLTLVGNERDQLMRSGEGGDTLDGGFGGQDTYRGNGGADTFVFASGWGNDRIFDFEQGVDVIDMSGTDVTGIEDFDLFRQVRGNTKIVEGDDTLILTGIVAADLTEDDFVFNLA